MQNDKDILQAVLWSTFLPSALLSLDRFKLPWPHGPPIRIPFLFAPAGNKSNVGDQYVSSKAMI